MTRILRLMTLWLWGGFIYYCVELLWRGHSHPAMFAVGGLCFLLVGALNNYLPWEMGIVWQCILGGVVITAVELLSGIVLNVWLGMGIWDYSDMPFNVLGQICLQYALLWVPLAGVGIWLDDWLRWKLYGEREPGYTWV